MMLTRPGRDPSRKPVAFGSHLDTQPTGGKFDGVLGVLAGLEMLRAVHEAGIETERRSCSSTGPTRKARASRPP
jgi:beta-ureidopropionase / N-carbamoyl-L-amino-acid hydrolase